MKLTAIAMTAAVIFVTPAQARYQRQQQRPQPQPQYQKNDILLLEALKRQTADIAALRQELTEIRHTLRPDAVVEPEPEPYPAAMQYLSTNPAGAAALAVAYPTKQAPKKIVVAALETDDSKTIMVPPQVETLHRPITISLAGYPGPLIDKTQEIVDTCNSRVTSAFRPGSRVRGSGRLSNHAFKKAVDVAGNPKCIYAHLAGWPGGYSTDYAAVAHVHISYAPHGAEWGARFVHYRGGHHHRYAHHRRHHYALRPQHHYRHHHRIQVA
jgi:hypothetical protein